MLIDMMNQVAFQLINRRLVDQAYLLLDFLD